MNPSNPRWIRLDNAAKIYPATLSRSWSSIFRLSMTLREEVDPATLQAALAVVLKRFPSIAMRLRRGMFWYYFEEVAEPPQVRQDGPWPCARMSRSEIRRCSFRVLYYGDRIAVEFFHALTDGTGGLSFLKTLTAEYIERRHGVAIPSTDGVLDRRHEPTEQEMEDSFLRHEGLVPASRREADAYHIHGTRPADGFVTVTTGVIPLEAIRKKAKEAGVTLTIYLASVMIYAIAQVQDETVHPVLLRRPVKVMIPVNLRPYFQSHTLRNFSSYINPGIDPRMGHHSLEEIIKSIHHQMGNELTAKKLCSRITTNVRSEKNLAVKVMPLFVKNISLKLVYKAVGDRKFSIAMSNLGAVTVPEEMDRFVERVEFVLGAPSQNTSICGVATFHDQLVVNILRTIAEPTLEHAFFTTLRKLDVPVKLETNRR